MLGSTGASGTQPREYPGQPTQQMQFYQSGGQPPTMAIQPVQSQGNNAPTQPYQQYQQQGQYAYPQQPVVIQNTQTVVVTGRQKSVALAVFLAFLLGPLGMFYSTVAGALTVLLLNVILLGTTAGTGWVLTWIVGMVWAGAAASSHNSRVVTTYQQSTAYPPNYR